MRSWLSWHKNVITVFKFINIATTGRAVALLKNGAKGKVKREPSIKFRVDLGKFSVEPNDESANRRKCNKVKVPSTSHMKNLFTSTIKSKKRDTEEKMMF